MLGGGTVKEILCEEAVLHEKNIQQAREDMPDDATVERSVRFFKAFGDKTRLKILCLLRDSDLCVCDIAYILQMEQTAVSHQLKILRELYIVRSRREGKSIIYSLDDEHVFTVIDQSIAHMKHN